jgi:P27 family predicted phage terminase small subunit
MLKHGIMAKPAEIHKLNGTLRSYHSQDIKAPMIGGMPDAPRTMSEQAREWWRIKVIDLQDMGLLYRCDMELLAKYCNLLADMDDARTKINASASGTDVGSRLKLLRYHNEALRYAILMAREFGFSPLARTKIRIASQKEKDAFDEI